MRACALVLLFACVPALADPAETLPGIRPLTDDGDLSKAMLDGLHRFAERKIDASVDTRAKLWNRDTRSREAYEKSDAGQPRIVPEDHRCRRPAPCP